MYGICICMYICVSGWGCTCVGNMRLMIFRVFPSDFHLTFWNTVSYCTWRLPIWQDRQASKVRRFHIYCCLALGLQGCTTLPNVCIGARNLTSDSHA